MGYIDKNLLKNEVLLYRTHLNWVIFISPAFWTIFIILLVSSREFQQLQTFFNYGGFLFSLYLWSSAVIQYATSEFGVTNQRVLIKKGFIRIFSFEILLSRIESIRVQQSILGRILNYGSIFIIGTGGSTDPFRWIDDPLNFRKKVQEQIETLSGDRT